MRKRISLSLAVVMAFGTLAGGVGFWGPQLAQASSTKISLDASMVVNESGKGNAGMLVDEQGVAGDPEAGTGGSPTTTWFPGWGSTDHPASAYIDLGQEYQLTEIYLYDANGIADFVVEAGSPGNWTALFTDGLTTYLTWREHVVNVQTQYIRVTRTSGGSNVAEIVLYGEPVGGGGGDTTAPGDVNDLSAVSTSASAVQLEWTAPGDDGGTGTAAAYDVRYSTSPITSSNWGSAAQATGEPSPSQAGATDSVTVSGLTAGTTYYFALKTKDEANNESGLSNVLQATTNQAPVSGKIVLEPEMVINVSGFGDATLLVDEQQAAGDPLNGSGGATSTNWFPGWTWQYPASAVIDLGVEHQLSDIYLYDTNGSGTITIEGRDANGWFELATDGLTGYNAWKRHQVNDATRYVKVTRTNGSGMHEIVLYGAALGTPEAPPQPVPYTPAVTMNEFIGINAFIDDPLDKMAVAGTVREYHDWNWDAGGSPAYPNTEYKFNPSYGGPDGGWDFDSYYDMLKDAGIHVFPDLKQNVSWIYGETNERDSKPISEGEDAEDPFSYAEVAERVFQYVARYGSATVADAKLKLASDQDRLSGLGLLDYFEDWNEQNQDWNGRSAYFTPFEYAAMASANYDGHQGAMGSSVGLKNADPNAKMVMGGLAGINVEYMRGIKLWADLYRDGDVPFDVINVHHYSRNSAGTSGISPEADGLKDRLEEMVEFRNRYMPGKEIWISEFGYDTNQGSVQKAPAIGSFSGEEVQGQWLVRSYLAIAAAGVDRAQMYMMRDVDGGYGLYASSGLTSSMATGWIPKRSWYYVYTMRNVLGETKFLGEQASGNANVMIYKFKNANDDSGVYAVWAPTSNQTSVNGYTLTLAGNPTAATLVEMAAGDTDGVSTALSINNNTVIVNVSERPVFIEVDDIE